MKLFDTIIAPTTLYGSEVWGPSLGQLKWAQVERLQTIMLQHLIHCKRTVPQCIIQAEFGANPLHLECIFRLTSYLHRLWKLGDSVTNSERYPYLALYSSVELASHSSLGQRG